MAADKKLYKDKENINRREQSVQIQNLNELAEILINSAPCSNERKKYLKIDTLEPDDRRHNPDHKKCDYKNGVDSERMTEKRICRCMYYYNNGNMEQRTECKDCKMEWKSRENVSDYKILDYEVSMPTVAKTVGGIDLVLQDMHNPDVVYATEVKPKDSSETLARMIAEILTYCEVTDYQIKNDGKDIPVKPAICFFEGSKQFNDFFDMKDEVALQKLLKDIKAFYISCKEDSFTIHDAISAPTESVKKESKRTASPKVKFDAIIKQNLICSGKSNDNQESFGYQINGRFYGEYYTEEHFHTFVQEMKREYPNHYRKYAGDDAATENKGGVGGELDVRKTGYGFAPPKMASVASSSRFCYLALRDGTEALVPGRVFTKDDIEFEKECRIFDRGHAPQLDAYIPAGDMNIYVEVKCHEIFDRHAPTFKNKYWQYFKENNVLACAAPAEAEHQETFTIPLEWFGLEGNEKSTMFDIKQLVCHLLGIARQNEGKKAKLIYLFFKPKCEDEEQQAFVDKLFADLKREINAIFKKGLIPAFCQENNIELEAVAEESDVMCRLKKSNMVSLI